MPILEEIEDIDDIDNLDMDLAEFDPTLKTPVAPARPKPQVTRSSDDGSSTASPFGNPQMDAVQQMMKSMGMEIPEVPEMDPAGITGSGPNAINKNHVVNPNNFTEEQLAEFKSFPILYPCYFDRNRSEREGRRVKKTNAVSNPLAKTIVDACASLGIHAILEAEKTHPQDFGNPGRVRVIYKEPNGDLVNPNIKNKRILMNKISEYLLTHKSTLKNLKELPAPPELSAASFEPEEVAKVKGFKMNTIVPLHSPLLMKNPQTKSVYVKEAPAPPPPKIPKQKVQRIRG